MATVEKKGNKVKLETFLKWGKSDVIGYVLDNDNNLTSIFCKLCAKHKNYIQSSSMLKGKAKNNALNYTKNVYFVKKSNVDRHLLGEAHSIAVRREGNDIRSAPSSFHANSYRRII